MSERYGRQLGPLAAVMDTSGPLTIVIGTQQMANRSLNFLRIASTIAQNLYIYFGAEVDIRYDYEVEDWKLDGNVIALGMEDENIYLERAMRRSHFRYSFPIETKMQAIHINDTSLVHTYRGENIGAIFLCPLTRGRLMVVVCGTDEKGLERAARLFPYRTGVGQPDWIVVGPKMGVQGMQGVEAMGYYSNLWAIEPAVSHFS